MIRLLLAIGLVLAPVSSQAVQKKQCKSLITVIASVRIVYKAGEAKRVSERNTRNAALLAAKIKWANLTRQSFGPAYTNMSLANEYREGCAKGQGDYNCYANGFPCRIANELPPRKFSLEKRRTAAFFENVKINQ